jgi:NNP family nitrate/nitrite transporter-like MFS transporter
VGAFLAALLLKSKSAVAESAAIAANSELGSQAVKAAQTAASASAVSNGYFLIGGLIVGAALLSLTIRFAHADEKAVVRELEGEMA